MIRVLETIKIDNGKIFNLKYHQKRFDKSRNILFASKKKIALQELIKPPKDGLFRCRIVYNKEVQSIKYIPYAKKKINSINIVTSNIEYPHKYEDRDELNSLLEKQTNCDEIIIEKDGYLTDTTIANIALFHTKENVWYTPKKPLLYGTTRERLMENNYLIAKNIKKNDLGMFSHLALINAMVGFDILDNIKLN